jgi:Nitronate monooxygenase
MHPVGSVEEARRAVGAGVDIIVAQGWKAGGHVGSGVATLALVSAVVDAVAPVPVIAAGGIGDARGWRPLALQPLAIAPLRRSIVNGGRRRTGAGRAWLGARRR